MFLANLLSRAYMYLPKSPEPDDKGFEFVNKTGGNYTGNSSGRDNANSDENDPSRLAR